MAQTGVRCVSVPAGTDFGPLLRNLPEDRCQGPHWGYVLKGRLRIQYASGEEVLSAGDFYHMPPGHTGIAEEDRCLTFRMFSSTTQDESKLVLEGLA